MKIYFAQVPQQDVVDFGTDGLFCFNHFNEKAYFYNQLEFGTGPGGLEDVIIRDSVGRSVPLSVNSIGDLITALHQVQDMVDTIEAGEDAKEFAFSNHKETV